MPSFLSCVRSLAQAPPRQLPNLPANAESIGGSPYESMPMALHDGSFYAATGQLLARSCGQPLQPAWTEINSGQDQVRGYSDVVRFNSPRCVETGDVAALPLQTWAVVARGRAAK
jgi:hypothetical protein